MNLSIERIREVNKIATRKGGLNCDPLKINLQLKINSQVVYLEGKLLIVYINLFGHFFLSAN